jgi:hypothetical protein
VAGAEQGTSRARGERVNLRVADARGSGAEPTILGEEVAWNSQRAWIHRHYNNLSLIICGC